MLTTLAMVVIAVAVLVFGRGDRRAGRGAHGHDLMIDLGVIRQDLGYFLVMYALAVLAGLLRVKIVDYGLAIVLVVGYGYYVRRHFDAPGEPQLEREAATEIHPLHVWQWLRRIRPRTPAWVSSQSTAAPFVQVAVALALIVGGAELFVHTVGGLAERFAVPPLAFSLLLAPLATELPEKFNSVLWIRRGKDTLAMGNMTGAMVFQSSFPVTVGLLLTPWRLADEALVAAVIALVAGSVLYVTLRVRHRLSAPLLLLQGVFYAGYVWYVISRL
jgi:cation:H+ antiporter